MFAFLKIALTVIFPKILKNIINFFKIIDDA